MQKIAFCKIKIFYIKKTFFSLFLIWNNMYSPSQNSVPSERLIIYLIFKFIFECFSNIFHKINFGKCFVLSEIRTQSLKSLTWDNQPLWPLDHQDWNKNFWLNDKDLLRLKNNISNSENLIENSLVTQILKYLFL
jgi:hypothetical protein